MIYSDNGDIHEDHKAKTYHHSPSGNICSTSRRATWPWGPSSCWPPIQGALRPCIPWRSWRMPSSSERLYSVHFLLLLLYYWFYLEVQHFPKCIQMCLWQCFACLLIVLFCKLRPQNQKPSGSESDRIYFWNQRHDRVPSFGAVIQHWAMWNGLSLSLAIYIYNIFKQRHIWSTIPMKNGRTYIFAVLIWRLCVVVSRHITSFLYNRSFDECAALFIRNCSLVCSGHFALQRRLATGTRCASDPLYRRNGQGRPVLDQLCFCRCFQWYCWCVFCLSHYPQV